MAKWAIGFGAFLTALGLVGYFGADPAVMTAEPVPAVAQGTAETAKAAPSKTALIPAVFGLLLLICGTLGLDERLRKHALHAAAAIGLVGFLAAGGRLGSKMGDVLSGNISRPMWFIILMAVLCLAYVVLSVRSFIQARRARANQA